MPVVFYLFLIPFLNISPSQMNGRNIPFLPDTIVELPPDTNLVEVEDTIIYDTVIIVKEPVVIKKEIVIIDSVEPPVFGWSAGLWVSPGFTFNQTKANTGNYEKYAGQWDNNHSERIGFAAGADIRLHKKKLFLQTGVAWRRYRDGFEHSWQLTSVDTNVTIHTDTLDSYYVVNNADTSWYYVTEDTEVTNIDTTYENKKFKSDNRYDYLEIPLTAGYNFRRGKAVFSFRLGLINGFLIEAEAQAADPADSTIVSDVAGLFGVTKYIPSAIAAAGISYYVSSNVLIFAEAGFRADISTVFSKQDPFYVRRNTIGFKAGVILLL